MTDAEFVNMVARLEPMSDPDDAQEALDNLIWHARQTCVARGPHITLQPKVSA